MRELPSQTTKGQLRRRTAASVERTIDSMPPELQEEWADEWRADLAQVETIPFTAVRFAINLRRTARELVRAGELATATEASLGAPGRRALNESGASRRVIVRITQEASQRPRRPVARLRARLGRATVEAWIVTDRAVSPALRSASSVAQSLMQRHGRWLTLVTGMLASVTGAQLLVRDLLAATRLTSVLVSAAFLLVALVVLYVLRRGRW